MLRGFHASGDAPAHIKLCTWELGSLFAAIATQHVELAGLGDVVEVDY